MTESLEYYKVLAEGRLETIERLEKHIDYLNGEIDRVLLGVHPSVGQDGIQDYELGQ